MQLRWPGGTHTAPLRRRHAKAQLRRVRGAHRWPARTQRLATSGGAYQASSAFEFMAPAHCGTRARTASHTHTQRARLSSSAQAWHGSSAQAMHTLAAAAAAEQQTRTPARTCTRAQRVGNGGGGGVNGGRRTHTRTRAAHAHAAQQQRQQPQQQSYWRAPGAGVAAGGTHSACASLRRQGTGSGPQCHARQGCTRASARGRGGDGAGAGVQPRAPKGHPPTKPIDPVNRM